LNRAQYNYRTFKPIVRLTRVYENTREPNCQGIKERKALRGYEPELTRVWPRKIRRRETEIALFAEQHGWRLRYYKDGFCAIFDSMRNPKRGRRVESSAALAGERLKS
jgi:hypothetical protein